jgi:hypothetical protein
VHVGDGRLAPKARQRLRGGGAGRDETDGSHGVGLGVKQSLGIVLFPKAVLGFFLFQRLRILKPRKEKGFQNFN